MLQNYTIGVDMGGTNTILAAVDNSGNIIDKLSFSTSTISADAWADCLCRGINDIISRNNINDSVTGIGIGAPCANTLTGNIEAATDLPWPSPIPLKTMIESRTGLPVTIGNDANAAAIGEMIYGAAIGMKNFIVLTLGTGVGAGVVCDGHLLNGSRGFAGELGHVTFSFAEERLCGCGRKGCLQTVASAKGIRDTALRLLDTTDTPSTLRSIPESELTSRIVAEAAIEGDTLSKEVYEFTGLCLGKAAAEFAAFTDPEAIILFGGVAQAGDLLLKPMEKSFRHNALHLYRDNVRLLTSGLNDTDAALLGAAALPSLQKK